MRYVCEDINTPHEERAGPKHSAKGCPSMNYKFVPDAALSVLETDKFVTSVNTIISLSLSKPD